MVLECVHMAVEFSVRDFSVGFALCFFIGALISCVKKGGVLTWSFRENPQTEQPSSDPAAADNVDLPLEDATIALDAITVVM
ncbi:unnamed protein product [Eruca vesicaria subsp. sativa]|uniref:Uncharacterized protein n=1 Tax=Eruca vesicaria subsp. sativa TaxID=29727 RepID=A0ABC8KEY2_ERUVS|nr:unnamed protein product [Eruca vesicaria subsp. sativa]